MRLGISGTAVPLSVGLEAVHDGFTMPMLNQLLTSSTCFGQRMGMHLIQKINRSQIAGHL
jgi:hypothetical protein